MLKEFKAFAMKGNVLDMAIGVIIGGAFGKIVSSLVSDVLMPPLGLLMGKVDFSSLFINLSSTPQPSLIAAKAAGSKPSRPRPPSAPPGPPPPRPNRPPNPGLSATGPLRLSVPKSPGPPKPPRPKAFAVYVITV